MIMLRRSACPITLLVLVCFLILGQAPAKSSLSTAIPNENRFSKKASNEWAIPTTTSSKTTTLERPLSNNLTTQDLTRYVNPFIGTSAHGHTYPGPTLPFGMVQLSPDTRLTGWDGCSGYHYSDSRIYGFSHTHLSGTGISDYGDILLMPTVGPALRGFAARFQHRNETAAPGYYSVKLDDHDILVELTTTARVGIH